MEQQRNNIGIYQMFKLSASTRNSYPQPKSPPINRMISDRLLQCRICLANCQ